MSNNTKSVAVQYKERFFELDIALPDYSNVEKSNDLLNLKMAFQEFCKSDTHFYSKMANHFPVFEVFNSKFNRYLEMSSKTVIPEDSPIVLKFVPNCSPVKSSTSNNKNLVHQV